MRDYNIDLPVQTILAELGALGASYELTDTYYLIHKEGSGYVKLYPLPGDASALEAFGLNSENWFIEHFADALYIIDDEIS